jgi:cytochrome c55X
LSNNSPHIFWIGVLPLAMAISALARADSFAEISVPVPARQAELLNLIRQDCGSCHGLRLEGGLGLPLTPQALKEKSPEALKQTILHGRGGTPMPPWNPFLTEVEAGWIVETLLKGLP